MEWLNFEYDKSTHSHTMGLFELEMEVCRGMVPQLHILFISVFSLKDHFKFQLNKSNTNLLQMASFAPFILHLCLQVPLIS